VIAAEIQAIFQRMGLNYREWLEIVQHFGRRYRLAAGVVDRRQQCRYQSMPQVDLVKAM